MWVVITIRLLGWLAHGVRPLRGDAVRMDCNVGGDAFLVRCADDLDDAPGRLLEVGRVIENLGYHHLPVLRRAGLASQRSKRTSTGPQGIQSEHGD